MNAFLVPSVQVLETMAGTPVRVSKVSHPDRLSAAHSLSIVIELQGRLTGAVVISAERGVARALASRVAGAELGEGDEEEVRAILAEVANTIVGNATGRLYELGVRQNITPPTVVTGECARLNGREGMESASVLLQTELGRLEMIVCLNKESP